MRNRIASALLVGALALSPGFAFAEESGASIEQLVVDMADTPANHAAVAKFYREKAEDERAAAYTHQAMGRSYSRAKMASERKLEAHCNRISELNKATAEEYEAVAKLHEEASKKPQ